MCFPGVQNRSVCGWVCWCQVCFAGSKRGEKSFKTSALPALQVFLVVNCAISQSFLWAMGDFKLENTEYTTDWSSAWEPDKCLLSLINVTRNLPDQTKGAFSVFCSHSAVGRISVHAYIYRYIRQSYRICTAPIYAELSLCVCIFLLYLVICYGCKSAVWKNKKNSTAHTETAKRCLWWVFALVCAFWNTAQAGTKPIFFWEKHDQAIQIPIEGFFFHCCAGRHTFT